MAASGAVNRSRASGGANRNPSAGGRQPARRSGYDDERVRRSSQSAKNRKKRRRKKSKAPIAALTAFIFLLIVIAIVYFIGYFYYGDRFTANTFINGTDVSGMTYKEAATHFEHTEIPETIDIARPSDEIVSISLEKIGYKYSYSDELEKIFKSIDRKSWFACFFNRTDYSFTDFASYDKDMLIAEITNADWGSNENQDAVLKSNTDGYYIQAEVQGDVFEMQVLRDYIIKNLDNAVYTMKGIDSGAYIPPDRPSTVYDQKLETLNKMWNVKLYYNFDYKKELLTGKQLCKLINVKRDGSYTVDEDACMKYIEKLAKKYDTYNTKRKFKSTLQGQVVVPTSSDAKYGWWLDQEQCKDQLVRYLKKGKTKKNIEPIYYKQGNFEFSGYPSDRSEKSDIGKTYIEVDLTNQQWWYYKNGKKKRHGYIVSGQTTSAARTTLPGVYKLWHKATNYRMKDSNADGESWDTKCNYWNNISLCGIGMHDSTWRGAFGGEIYKYNGSHGCINMTYDDAKYIYDNIPLGIPVVMFY